MKIAYKRPDGGVSIVIAAPKDQLQKSMGPMTDAQYEEFVKEKLIPENAQNITYVSDAEIPKDKTFRNAWDIVDGKITVDLPKARQVHMAKIRYARNKKLNELDVETLKGVDVQDQKQVLRDIPQTFDLTIAQTPDELKALWPEQLERI